MLHGFKPKVRPFCEICVDADNAGKPDACPCTGITWVQQTMTMAYEDGSSGPYTNTIRLCWECRATFYAWGDEIVAMAIPRGWGFV